MRHIVKLLTEKGVTDLDDAVNFLIKEGYISVHHLYYQDIFDYYKSLEQHYQNLDIAGYKLRAREETCKHFKVSRRTFYNAVSAFRA